MQDYYRLRWKFEFSNKPPKIGVWDLTSKNIVDAAWHVDKANLVRALIEGETLRTQQKSVLFECYGPDYVSCQGENFAAASLYFSGSSKLRQFIYGISFLTRTEKVTVVKDGTLTRRPLTEAEKQFKIHEHIVGA